ncbi:DUF1365 domain-containing protein [Pontibacter sp. JAM-7]|uniref:DUF1365 domain-containing protein n=1 Tax=Pontibacter sp. JAM-7 TaxID=3366581 RepID=UPI003AF9C150
MPDVSACLYRGHVMHQRHQPVKHRFVYRVFAACFELQTLNNTSEKLRCFSRNRFNLYALYDKDHGLGSNNLLADITHLLHRCGYGEASHSVRLLCYPRILGYQFNPLSEYFCYDASGQLNVIIHEVHNTFGQRHLYLIPAHANGDTWIQQTTEKQMYVSPFTPFESQYRFKIQPPLAGVRVHIRQVERETGAPILDALFQGKSQALTDKNLLINFFRYPLMTLKIITAIHWEAFRLWRQKLTVQPRPASARCNISWQSASGETLHETL